MFLCIITLLIYQPVSLPSLPGPTVSERNRYHDVAELVNGNTRYVFRLRPSDNECAVRKYVNGVKVHVQHFRNVEVMRNRYRYLLRDGFTVA